MYREVGQTLYLMALTATVVGGYLALGLLAIRLLG
jgi:hypothetical protein